MSFTSPLASGDGSWDIWCWVFLGAAVATLCIFLVLLAPAIKLWIQAHLAKTRIGILELLGMRFHKVDAHVIVLNKIRADQAGLNVGTSDMKRHYLAGGRVSNVITALIAANRANIDLGWRMAASIDLAGQDILDAVQTAVHPKVIECPDPSGGKTTINAVAKDGIQLKVKARVRVLAFATAQKPEAEITIL